MRRKISNWLVGQIKASILKDKSLYLCLLSTVIFISGEIIYDYFFEKGILKSTNWTIYWFCSMYSSLFLITLYLFLKMKRSILQKAYAFLLGFIGVIIVIELSLINTPFQEYIEIVNDRFTNRIINLSLCAGVGIICIIELVIWLKKYFHR